MVWEIESMTASSGRKTIVIHDTDVHGFSCGVTALYALMKSGVSSDAFSNFSTKPGELATNPWGLANVVRNLGVADLVILDIPVDDRDPKSYVDALISHARYKGRVLWADHHGHSSWVDELNKNGVTAIVVGSSFELALLIPRMYGKVDGFVEKWALVGAIADFDTSIASKVPTELEIDVAEYLDPVMKFKRDALADALGIGSIYRSLVPSKGNVGALSYLIAEHGIEVARVIEIAKRLGSPIPLPRYEIVGDVVYTTELPPQGLSWKVAWKLCAVTGAKVAIVPAFNPRTNQYAVIIAKNWRHPEVTEAIERYVNTRFAGRQIVGHPGARSISMMSLDEVKQVIPQIARELSTYVSSGSIPATSTAEEIDRMLNEVIKKL